MDESDAGLATLSSLDDPVRSRLYRFVAGAAEPVSRDEAAAATGIGRPLAAYHLDKLVGCGLLTASYQRHEGRSGPGAGRPAKLYARSGREFAVTVPPREYALAARLLAAAVESDPGGTSKAALHEAAQEFGAGLGRRSRPGTGVRTSDRQVMETVLREHGFEPRHDADGTIRLRNCPFHQLAARHPDVICGMNLALVQGLAAGLGATRMRPVLAPLPDHCCVAIGAARATERTAGTGVS